MAQLVKCLLHKLQDLSLNLQNPRKNWAWEQTYVTPVLWCVCVNRQIPEMHRLAKLAEADPASKVQRETLSQNRKDE